MPTIIKTFAFDERLYEGYAIMVIIAPMARRMAPVRRNSFFRARFWFF